MGVDHPLAETPPGIVKTSHLQRVTGLLDFHQPFNYWMARRFASPHSAK
jgi:hypothetical protein